MMRGALRWIVASGFVLAVAQASPARADEAPPAPAPATKTAGKKLGHARRPVFLGVLAAGFLLIAGLAGANDRIHGDERAWGLMPTASYGKILESTLERDYVSRFARFEIDAQAAWHASAP